MNRRNCITALLSLTGIAMLNQPIFAAQVRRRRRLRRRIRRRYRRLAVTRIVRGRRMWVVPVGLAIGWELMHENRLVVVREIRYVERDGARAEVVTVQDSEGLIEEVEVQREDTPENQLEFEGSVLADDDQTTPGREDSIEPDANN